MFETQRYLAERKFPLPASSARPCRPALVISRLYGARLGVMRQDDPACAVTWFDIDPCYVFHVGGAHTDAAGLVVVDGARYAPADVGVMWGGAPDGPGSAPLRGPGPGDPAAAAAATGAARMHRWVLDPRDGTVSETALEDRGVEFPTIDASRVGRNPLGEKQWNSQKARTISRSRRGSRPADHRSRVRSRR